MPRDLSNRPDMERGKVTPSDAPGQNLAAARAMQGARRSEYLEMRRSLVAELTRCHEDTVVIAPLIQELRSISCLDKTFSFKDALKFPLHSQGAVGERAVHALKSRIAAAVQSVANQVDTICPDPEKRDVFMSRLERQFQDIQRKLIFQEHQRCADKLQALCGRIDGIVSGLKDFPDNIRQHAAFLSVMSRTLRAYAEERLGQASISVGGPEIADRRGDAAAPTMSVSEFFNLLDNLTVETLNVTLDQAA